MASEEAQESYVTRESRFTAGEGETRRLLARRLAGGAQNGSARPSPCLLAFSCKALSSGDWPWRAAMGPLSFGSRAAPSLFRLPKPWKVWGGAIADPHRMIVPARLVARAVRRRIVAPPERRKGEVDENQE